MFFMYEIYETKERVMADNDAEAEKLRAFLRSNRTFFINLMGSPGSGKTSVLIQTINKLKEKYRIAVMEADVEGHSAAFRWLVSHGCGHDSQRN